MSVLRLIVGGLVRLMVWGALAFLFLAMLVKLPGITLAFLLVITILTVASKLGV